MYDPTLDADNFQSLLTIPVCVGIAISTSRRRKQLADRAQQVVLACARFDTDGKLMVTHEGLLPCQKITVQHNQRVSKACRVWDGADQSFFETVV